MKKQGFLLGLFSIGGQVLLLRELVSSLNGDELFIGTALFGWLIAVAVGAWFGGRSARPRNPVMLFIAGAILLPIMIIAARLSPLSATSITGEIIPFGRATIISILVMFPPALISGWLFPLITRHVAYPATDAIVTVYLFEGIGAFAGGVFMTLAAGSIMSTLSMGVLLSLFVVISLFISTDKRRSIPAGLGYIISVVIALSLIPHLDNYLEGVKYDSYTVRDSFDTPYGHEAILSRDSTLVLMTDNTIEAVFPDPEAAENQIIAPLIYNPTASKILFVGRAEFGAAQLADALRMRSISAVDPRTKLTSVIGDFMSPVTAYHIYNNDPVAFFKKRAALDNFDIIVINPGEPDSYKNSRLFMPEFLAGVKRSLSSEGIVCLPLPYDTDRYLSPEKQQVLAIIYNSLKESFSHIAVWPGTTTIFLASDKIDLDLPLETIMTRIDSLPVEAQYIAPEYLYDRLSPLKIERLMTALSGEAPSQTLTKPILSHYQALYRSMADSLDRRVISFVLGTSSWIIIVPALVLILFLSVQGRRGRSGQYGIFLYFTAGAASLSLELMSFYLYQTMAGSLYSEMALLIGSFMLGLAVGTYYAHRVGEAPLEYPALIIMLMAVLVFMVTWSKIGSDALLPFHMFFLFVVAIATGTLFVAATNICYGRDSRLNRGVGYAWELAGSALGALLVLTILLPAIGLTWLLISLAALITLALAGSTMTHKSLRLP